MNLAQTDPFKFLFEGFSVKKIRCVYFSHRQIARMEIDQKPTSRRMDTSAVVTIITTHLCGPAAKTD